MSSIWSLSTSQKLLLTQISNSIVDFLRLRTMIHWDIFNTLLTYEYISLQSIQLFLLNGLVKTFLLALLSLCINKCVFYRHVKQVKLK